jgi:hypothetical protein
MSWRERLKSWILADPEQSTLYDALDLELSRRERFRLDAADGVGTIWPILPCWERDPKTGRYCTLEPEHGGEHWAEDRSGDLVAVWPVVSRHE